MRHIQHDALRRYSLVTETLGMNIDPDHGSVRWRGQPKGAAARRSDSRPGSRSVDCRANERACCCAENRSTEKVFGPYVRVVPSFRDQRNINQKISFM